MLKIGEFSKLSRVSVRMLRHYDEIGLLKPAEIDGFTDYRYYREDQLPTAGRIAALKDMGFSLADIIRILEIYDDRKQLEQFFSARQEELEALSRETEHKLTLLDAARKRLRKEENMSYNVTIKTIPERYAATVRMIIPRYEDEGMLLVVMIRSVSLNSCSGISTSVSITMGSISCLTPDYGFLNSVDSFQMTLILISMLSV